MPKRPVPDQASARAILRHLGYASEDAVAEFQQAWGREASGVLDVDTIVLAVDAYEAHRLGARLGQKQPGGAATGTITAAAGEPAPGLEVRLVEQGFRDERPLGTDKTDAAGRYGIVYPRRAARDRALFLRVLDSGQVVAESAPTFAVLPLLTIDLVVDARHIHRPTEIERMTDDVRRRSGGVPVEAIAAGAAGARDLAFLAGATGWSVEQLTHLVVAHRLERLEQHGAVPAAYFYALLREGTLASGSVARLDPRVTVDLGTPVRALLADIVLVEPARAKVVVAAAVAERLVPATLARNLDAILATLGRSAVAARDHIRTERPRQLLQSIAANVAAGKHVEVLAALSAHGIGNPSALAERLGAIGFVGGDGDPAADGGAGGAGATGAGALTALLAADPHIVEDVQALVDVFAAQVPDAASQAAAQAPAAAPARSRRFDPAALRGAPAAAARMERSFPTAAFVERLAATDARRAPTHRQAVVDILRAHPEIDLATANVDALVGDRPDARPVRGTLKAMQRVFKLAPSYRQTSALLDAGVHSAAQIAGMGRTRFVRRFTGDGTFTEAEALTVYRKAADVHAAAGLLAAELRGVTAARAKALLPAGVAQKVKAAAEASPTLKNLFQLTDLCACQECNAVDSPAAYLVDVLQFIGDRLVVDTTLPSPLASKDAKQVLLARRPDLGDIDLSCDNTNVPLPYIDVVCELLEQTVAPDPGIAYAGHVEPGPAPAALLSALAAAGMPYTAAAFVQTADADGNLYARDAKVVCKLVPAGAPDTWTAFPLRQTFLPADELAAMPAYVNDAAYDVLGQARIAFHLPYDLNHQEARAYFTQFGVAREALMRALAVGGAPAPAAVAADALDLGPTLRQLVVTPDAPSQVVFWNTAPDDPVARMRVVDTLLTRAEITYAELETLLACTFVNPDAVMFIQHLDSSCDTTQKVIANLDADGLDRVHRFLRLQKALGWDMATLDRAVMAPRLGNGVLDDACLVELAALKEVEARLGLPVDDLVVYYGTLPTAGDPSRYARVFQNAAADGAAEPALAPAAVEANPAAATPLLLGDVADPLARALGMAPEKLAALVAALGAAPLTSPLLNPAPPGLGNDVLSFAGLAALWAQASLAAALGRTPGDLVIVEQLTGENPLASPSATRRFLAEHDRIGAAGIAPGDLRFLLSFTADDLAARTLKDAAVTALLVTLQAALQKAWTQNRSPYDPALTADENLNGARGVVGQLPGVTAAQLSGLQSILDGSYDDPAVTAAAFIDALFGPFLDPVAVAAIKADQGALAALVPSGPPAQIEAARQGLTAGVLGAVSLHLYGRARDAAVGAAVSAGLGIDPALADAILDGARLGGTSLRAQLGTDALIDLVGAPPAPPAVTPAAFVSQYAAVRLARQISTFTASLPVLATDDVSWLLAQAGALGWLELDALPYEPGMAAAGYTAWSRLQDFLALAARYPAVVNPDDAGRPFTMRGVFAAAAATATTRAELLALIGAVTGWDAGAVDALDTHFGLSTPDVSAYRDPAALLRLETAAVALRKLGLPLAEALPMVADPLTAAEPRRLRQALKTRYAPADWLGVLKQLYDPLREQKRAALVAYLVASDPRFTTSNDLFDHFLIDVEMCSCQPTSRIVSAHGSLQLFVQRCLLGVEATAVADVAEDSGWSQWSWMQAYRLWQANRQVFLYPENWILPALRDDKSEPFVALENALQQSTLDDLSIETATAGYLEALDQLAFLEVVSTTYEQRTYTTHVFARTKGGDPAVYFYRRYVKEKTWTPWQKVDLDIKSDHLVAFVRNGRLCLAWPIFTATPNPTPTAIVPAGTPGTPVPTAADQQWRIQLAVSEYANSAWTPSKTSQDAIAWPPQSSISPLVPKETFRFVPFDARAGGFMILCTLPTNTASRGGVVGHATIGGYSLTGCKGFPVAFQDPSPDLLLFYPQFRYADVVNERFAEGRAADNELTIRTFVDQQWRQILTATPDRYRVTYPQVFGLIDYILWLLYLLNQARSAPVTAMEGRAAGRRGVLPIPLGTFMPYFHEDGVRGYVVVPGFFSPRRRQRERVRTRRTFSDVLALVQDMVALARIYLPKLLQPAGNLPAVVQELVKDPLYVEVVTQIQGFAGLRYGIEFDNFYHPLVCPLRKTFYARGIDALMARGSQLQTTAFDFGARYQPTALVEPPLPRETVEFGEDNAYPVPAYAGYNWELFFHLPLAIAVRLTADQQFEKALAWFHYIFNPMDASSGSVPQKYWRTKPFFLRTTAEYVSERIDSILNGLDTATGGELDALKFAVEEWRENPYQPFRVARARTVAFQQTVLMKYLDNLVKWGDSLFIQGTMESVNQATQLYVMADKLLGPRPRIVPPVAPPPTETYNQLAAKSIDAFGNAMLELENLIPDLSLLPHEGDELPPPPLTLSSLYFCIPPNPTLLQLWDTVADRLFKIRHCQDINGVERVLALFAPPIDPGALVAAAAAGLSPAALLAGLSAPLPFYRFTVMATKAAELAQMVSSLGASLLAVLEKRDAETLARLRATQEIAVQGAMIAVRQQTLADAEAQLDVLQKGIDLTKAKAQYYRSRPFMNEGESSALNLNQEGLATQADARSNDQAAAIANLVPTFSIGVAGFGGSATFSASYGGSNIASSQSAWGQVTRDDAAQQTGNAQIAATLASYQRRQDDWTFQADLADKELTQLASQVVQAKIRVQVAAGDLAHQKLQLANAKQSDAFLRSKFTGKELYEHELGLLAAVYFAAYQLVLGVAHKAERCFQVEIGSDQTFIDYAYWDSQRKGLLAGERLLADIRKMEVVYLEQNRREYELTKNVSLAQLDPRALLSLQHTGACTFSLPEAIFDAGHPGHYFRRLRTVSLTVPCVSGPYTQVSCKLSLVGNRYRKNTTLNPSASQPFQKYVEVAGNDPRFVYNVGTIQSIATSQGQNDAGLFQVDFRDERYLPFERQGAISSWRLELPQAFRQFDYRTITDVVLNIKYTARDGGSGFRALVEQVLGQHLQGMLVSAQTTGLNQGFNVRLEYADAWHRLQQTASVPLTIGAHQLPFFTVGHKPKIAGARWLARVAGDPSSFEMSVDGSPFSLTQDPSLGNLCTATSPAIKLDTPFTLAAAGAASLQELSLVVNYTLGA